MAKGPTIADLLEATAAQAEATVATELRAAAKKLGVYSRAPGTKAQAQKFSKVVTANTVQPLGASLVECLTHDATHERFMGPEARQTGYTLCGLLVASLDDELADVALESLDEVRGVVATLLPRQAEAILFLTGLFPESPAAEALTKAATARLQQEPETEAARWARALDLKLPFTYWSAEVIVPGTVEGDQVNDASIHLMLWHYPGDLERSRWQVNFGVISGHTLGAAANWLSGLPGWAEGAYDRSSRKGPSIAGTVEPLQDPVDLPRILTDLERAHPELTFDRKAIKTSARPGRLLNVTAKKKLVAWLQGKG